MPKKIVQKETPILRDIAKEVKKEEIGTPKINKIIDEMKEALAGEDDGVAIAAPQIGYSLRIFVVSKKVEVIMQEKKPAKKLNSLKVANSNNETSLGKDLIFINPVIKKFSRDKTIVEEGCLSVRYLYGQVKRSNKATIEAYDENGNKFSRGGSGLLAQIFQHEVDHLNGILFIDKAKYVEEITPEQLKNHAKTQRKSKA